MNKTFHPLVRTESELALMRTSGEITAKALKKTLDSVKVGIFLKVLDKIAEDEILRLGGKSSFKTVPNYGWTTCLSVNDEVVHGIPRAIKLEEGDILSVDLGAVFKGWHTDAAWSMVVGDKKGVSNGQLSFLKTGQEALWRAVKQASDGKRIGDISAAIQGVVEGAGLGVVRSLVGHGVGRKPHEEPEIPGVGESGTGMILKAGMTLAIEVIYTAGSAEVYQKDDGWTIATTDGSLGGLFEMSVIVTKGEAEVITDWSSRW